ncbi:nucleotide-binding universal stress UspA family protein [Tamaricihabitans halophyticus]|uniref:Nucleotide-binding universal stress UspA family protein n=1 Tax=Tamaricihabitans halophyticus TaxID=1262583 RepID=A0A4R2QJ31_9PSEU|nr:universal stress protein [Tamaricihabitans halophyticus]TCP49383.1 nucleotide-binding universal stress UspA family protein [Tamaricihabitans halophyticus]
MPGANDDPTEYEIGKDGLSSIVVAMDGSTAAEHACAWAAGLARRERAKLILVYIEPLANPAYWTPMGMITATEAATSFVDELRETAAELLADCTVPWEFVHHRGDPASGLESVAAQQWADCIVVGRSRHIGGSLGTVPKALAGQARRPVVVVP